MTRNHAADTYADSLSVLVGIPEPSATLAGPGVGLPGWLGWRRLARTRIANERPIRTQRLRSK